MDAEATVYLICKSSVIQFFGGLRRERQKISDQLSECASVRISFTTRTLSAPCNQTAVSLACFDRLVIDY
jgi:hypothetical protein